MKKCNYICFLLCVLVLTSGCKKADKLYFVPIGDVSTLDIEGLVKHYREKFGIEARILERMQPASSDVDPRRRQLIAENLLNTMLVRYPDYANDKSVVLIGITNQDIYPQSEGWLFCFGWRGDRAAIASTARLDIHYSGEPSDEAVEFKRLRKIITKDIGLLYYGKSSSSNPRSVLYDSIGGIQELDQVSEDF
jgi:predicted Zn-dependent protease